YYTSLIPPANGSDWLGFHTFVKALNTQIRIIGTIVIKLDPTNGGGQETKKMQQKINDQPKYSKREKALVQRDKGLEEDKK
ncbi:unnamed protein product, partial [Thlaspi arvense]